MEGSILICEVQQNSDTTYRIYDFDRLVDGKLRELHIDKALDVIDFEGDVEITTDKSRKKILLAGAEKEELIRGEYFNIDKYLVDGEFKDEINKLKESFEQTKEQGAKLGEKYSEEGKSIGEEYAEKGKAVGKQFKDMSSSVKDRFK